MTAVTASIYLYRGGHYMNMAAWRHLCIGLNMAIEENMPISMARRSPDIWESLSDKYSRRL